MENEEATDTNTTSKRFEWTFLGRLLGTGTSWDGEIDSWCIYNFVPSPGVNLPQVDCLWIVIETGHFAVFKDDGTHANEWDIIETLKDLPRKG